MEIYGYLFLFSQLLWNCWVWPLSTATTTMLSDLPTYFNWVLKGKRIGEAPTSVTLQNECSCGRAVCYCNIISGRGATTKWHTLEKLSRKNLLEENVISVWACTQWSNTWMSYVILTYGHIHIYHTQPHTL